MKKTITFKRILNQLKADLIGKDSYRGITLTYAWLANQFGHIALGFIPSFLFYHLWSINEVKSAIYVSLFWLGFEILNFLVPLLFKKEKYVFKPKWLNVTFDTFTDVCFFVLGAFLFSLSITEGDDKTVIYILIALSVYLLFASRYWFITKMYQLNGKYPFQFRLSQWKFKMNDIDVSKIEKFESSKELQGNHLLIYGGFGTGKTSLGVAVLNELSIKNNSCLYVNAIKMFNKFFDDNDDLKSYEIWNWKTADFLMIDDVNPSEPIQDELITPDKLLSFIDTLKPQNNKNREILKHKNVIWVLGSKESLSKTNKNKWEKMLLNIGIEEHKISTINLLG